MNFVDLDRRAVQHSIEIVSSVTQAQLGLPTPCAAWDLRQLLVHMTREHRTFAAAARGETSAEWSGSDPDLGTDPPGAYAEAATDVLAAFATHQDLDREVWLPDITRTRTYPLRRALSFHFLDYVVHGWDVAATIEACREIEPDLAAACLRVARAEVPAKPERSLPGASFVPALGPVDGESQQERLLRLLGREPGWPVKAAERLTRAPEPDVGGTGLPGRPSPAQ